MPDHKICKARYNLLAEKGMLLYSIFHGGCGCCKTARKNEGKDGVLAALFAGLAGGKGSCPKPESWAEITSAVATGTMAAPRGFTTRGVHRETGLPPRSPRRQQTASFPKE